MKQRIICAKCKKPFMAYNVRGGRRRKFCSRRCAGSEKIRIIKTCQICKKRFIVSGQHRKQKHCSHTCAGLTMRKTFGSKHWNYKTGTGRGYNAGFRQRVFNTREHVCALCDAPLSKEFRLHYVDLDPRNQRPENVQLVCLRCFYTRVRSKYYGLSKKERFKCYQAKTLARQKEFYRIKREGRKLRGWIEPAKACKILNIGRERLRQLKFLKKIRVKIPPGYNSLAVYNLRDVEARRQMLRQAARRKNDRTS